MIFSLIAGGLQYLVQWAIDPLVRELSFPALMVQQSLVVALLALVPIIVSRRPVTGLLSPSHSSTP
jgi:hypothetical protein